MASASGGVQKLCQIESRRRSYPPTPADRRGSASGRSLCSSTVAATFLFNGIPEGTLGIFLCMVSELVKRSAAVAAAAAAQQQQHSSSYVSIAAAAAAQ